MINRSIQCSNFRILWLSRFIAIAGLTILMPLPPIYMALLQNLSVVEIQSWSGIATTAPAVMMIIVSPIWGKLGDRISRKWIVLRALPGSAVCSFLMTLCTAPLQSILVRLLQGLFGGVVDASSAPASVEASAEDRGKVLGGLQSSVSVGSFMGPLIGGVTASILGFNALLMGIAVITFIACIFGVLKLIETTHMPESQTPNINKDIHRLFQCLLRIQRTCRFITVGVLTNSAMYGMSTTLSPLASLVNYIAIDNRSVIGFLQSAFQAALILGVSLRGRFNNKSYVRSIYISTTIVCGCSTILQGLATNVEFSMAVRIFQGLAYNALVQSVMFVAVNTYHQQLKGILVGTTNSTLVIDQIIGNLSGTVITSYTTPATAFIVMGIVSAVGNLFLICSTITSQINDHTLIKLWELKQKSVKQRINTTCNVCGYRAYLR